MSYIIGVNIVHVKSDHNAIAFSEDKYDEIAKWVVDNCNGHVDFCRHVQFWPGDPPEDFDTLEPWQNFTDVFDGNWVMFFQEESDFIHFKLEMNM